MKGSRKEVTNPRDERRADLTKLATLTGPHTGNAAAHEKADRIVIAETIAAAHATTLATAAEVGLDAQRCSSNVTRLGEPGLHFFSLPPPKQASWGGSNNAVLFN